jgi:hypothetical protein
MGAEWFTTPASGNDLQDAFVRAAQNAQWEYGHRGYTGTIAEKIDSGVVDVLNGEILGTRAEAEMIADRFQRDEGGPLDDKWGPAGAVAYKDDSGEVAYLFFGWASS